MSTHPSTSWNPPYEIHWREACQLFDSARADNESDWAAFLDKCKDLLDRFSDLPPWYKAGAHLFIAMAESGPQRWHARKAVECYQQVVEQNPHNETARELLQDAEETLEQKIKEWVVTKAYRKAEERQQQEEERRARLAAGEQVPATPRSSSPIQKYHLTDRPLAREDSFPRPQLPRGNSLDQSKPERAPLLARMGAWYDQAIAESRKGEPQ